MQESRSELHKDMFIDGQWRPAAAGERLETVNPSTGAVLGSFPDADRADVDAAVEAAASAARDWAARPWKDRVSALDEMAARLWDHVDELAKLDTLEGGNAINSMVADAKSACEEIRIFAGLASDLKGHSARNGTDEFAYTLLEPYGIVGRIIPFNHPFKFAAAKSASALVTGNAVILKPAEQTSLSALRMAEICEDLFPPGVLNVVTGRGETAGAALAADPRVPRVAFTGSVATGQKVLSAGGPGIKHVTLELGGKNPMIVFADVEVELAADAAVRAMNFSRCQGQSCQSSSRILIHEDVYDEFVSAFLAHVSAMRIGDPMDPSNDMGPVTFETHYRRVLEYIGVGQDEGAKLVAGGEALDGEGFFIPPTVFSDVEPSMRIAQEEIFGPVVSLFRWRDYDDMIAVANGVKYGLTANVWTNDLVQAHKTAQALDAGYVWVRGRGKRVPATPFGGFKCSGIGKETGREELISYCQEKVVAVQLH